MRVLVLCTEFAPVINIGSFLLQTREFLSSKTEDLCLKKKKEIFFLAFHFQLIFALFLHFFYLPIDVAAVAIIYPPLQYYNCYSEQPIYRVFLGLFC